MSAERKISFVRPKDLERTLNGAQITVLQTMANAFEQIGEISEGSISDLILHMHQSDLLHVERSHQAIKDLEAKGFVIIEKDVYTPTEKFKKLFI